jgi:predicted membrane metal-binding protein
LAFWLAKYFCEPELVAWDMCVFVACSLQQSEQAFSAWHNWRAELKAELLIKGRILLGIALILLIVNPLWLLEISFQLSFVTVAGLIFLHSLVKKYLPAFLPVCAC